MNSNITTYIEELNIVYQTQQATVHIPEHTRSLSGSL